VPFRNKTVQDVLHDDKFIEDVKEHTIQRNNVILCDLAKSALCHPVNSLSLGKFNDCLRSSIKQYSTADNVQNSRSTWNKIRLHDNTKPRLRRFTEYYKTRNVPAGLETEELSPNLGAEPLRTQVEQALSKLKKITNLPHDYCIKDGHLQRYFRKHKMGIKSLLTLEKDGLD